MEPIVYKKGDFPIEFSRRNAYIAFHVGWNDGVQKFNVFEQRSFGWHCNNITYGSYATFAEAYAAAESAARDLAKGGADVALLAREDNAQDLLGSWGMSKVQTAELQTYLPQPKPEKVLTTQKFHWSEVRADFMETEQDFMGAGEAGDKLAQITIDAWKTPDENEHGEVIARVILSTKGDILVDYHDNIARTDPMAQEAIGNARERLAVYFKELKQEIIQDPPAKTDQNTLRSVQISSSNGTAKVLDNLTKAWRAMHEAYLGVSEINDGSWKQGQAPIRFTIKTSPELAASIRDLKDVFNSLLTAANENTMSRPLPDELVVRLAHYAGEMEARKQIAAPDWDDLCAAIRKAIDLYYDSPSETNPFHIENVAEQVFLERFPIGEKTFEPSSFLQLPDGSSIKVNFSGGLVNAHEKDQRTWQSLDIERHSTDGTFMETICSVDYEDKLGLRTIIYNPGTKDPFFTHEHHLTPETNISLDSIINDAETRKEPLDPSHNHQKERNRHYE